MKFPKDTVRCLDDNGPILYPTSFGPYKCETCGAGLKPGQTPGVGEYWSESYGYLVQQEVPDDDRDTEDEISDLNDVIATFATILGDGLTAVGIGGHFTCSEADDLARALILGGHKQAAIAFLKGHAVGDYDVDDQHQVGDDFEARALELAGLPVPELIELPDPVAPVESTTTHEVEVVTTEELVDLLNLN
ncbi:hypothetical protein [Streptomyces virginiae]